jgi:hypothetical protein
MRRGARAVSDAIAVIAAASAEIPGWTKGEDAVEVARASMGLGEDAVLVEVGVYMGRCSVLLASPLCLKGSGMLHCVDPFDGSGDDFSVRHYRDGLNATGMATLEEVFRHNIERLGLEDWIEVHKGKAAEVASRWSQAIDLLLLDGDQSPKGAREAFEAWVPFLKPGGTIILRNTRDRVYEEGHDGHRRLVAEELVAPRFETVRQVGATTFAIKSGAEAPGVRS